MAHEFSASAPDLRRKDYLLIWGAALAAIAAYLAASSRIHGLGFPLDDSWIHATYARNLALHGEWAFRLGLHSSGSTSPLWTLLLAPGYLVGLAPLWWSHLLGWVTLSCLGCLAEVAARRLVESYRPNFPWAGILITLEWHMVWAAASGMETLLFACLSAAILFLLVAGTTKYTALGLLVGLAVWVRPDGMTLLGPVVMYILLARRRVTWHRALAGCLLGLCALFVPYLVFNFWLSGKPMPNTFYAKQAEYIGWQARPITQRLAVGFTQLSTGFFVVLWPGLFLSAWRAIQARRVGQLAALGWGGAYAALYIFRMPAYQHGRYLMPVMPVLVVFGFLGLLYFVETVRSGRAHWAAAWAWKSALALLAAAFLVLGAGSYAADVALIETEMVETARWVSTNVPQGATLAAHDIGALGYVDDHDLVDLAGLVSPEVVPYIRNESRLADLLDREHVDYLIAFPSLYPELARESRPIHSSSGTRAEAAGLGKMTVYCWRCR